MIFFIRSRYNNKRNKIVFLALSDDYNWIKVRDNDIKQFNLRKTLKENFANYSDVRFAQEYRLKKMKKEDFVGFDLCVLATSDHTLITYGSFGLWGAILSRGDVIAAKGTSNETYSVVIML